MTRAERGLERERKLKEKLEADKKAYAQIQAANKAGERTARNKRRLKVGTLADDAGLFLWDDVTLCPLFALLMALRDVPDPVAVLESALDDAGISTASEIQVGIA